MLLASKFKLIFYKRVVFSLLLSQAGVCANFDNTSIVHNHNMVSIANS